MQCVKWGSSAVSERPERTAHGYRRFRCRACGKQFNERAGTGLNQSITAARLDTQKPSLKLNSVSGAHSGMLRRANTS